MTFWRPRIRTVCSLASLLLAVPARGDDPPPAGRERPAAAKVKAKGGPAFDAGREAVVTSFVRTHHPELAVLLESLKPMRPAEYRKAVGQIDQVIRSLDVFETRDPARYALGLEAWKARSRVELLTAKLASASVPGAELEGLLRRAVAAQLDAEIRQQRHDRDQAEARARRLSTSLRQLETDTDKVADARFQALLKKSRRGAARKGPAAKAAPLATGGAGTATKKTNANTNPNPSEGERPR